MRATICAGAVVAVLALALAGCRRVDRLDTVMGWEMDTGLCGWQVVIDARDALWKESGCENGVPRARRLRTVNAAERERVARALARLPQGRDVLTPAEAAPVIAAFASITRILEFPCHLSPTLTLRGADGRMRTWTVEVCPLPGASGESS